MQEVRQICRASQLYFVGKLLPWPLSSWLQRSFLRYSDETTQHALDRLFPGNHLLHAAVCYLYGDYGLPPSKASWVIHALVVHHFWPGAMYPVDGTGSIARALIPTIEAAGGRVLTQARVTELLMDSRGVAGVRVVTKQCEDTIPCRIVISTIGALNTYNKLIPVCVIRALASTDVDYRRNTFRQLWNENWLSWSRHFPICIFL